MNNDRSNRYSPVIPVELITNNSIEANLNNDNISETRLNEAAKKVMTIVKNDIDLNETPDSLGNTENDLDANSFDVNSIQQTYINTNNITNNLEFNSISVIDYLRYIVLFLIPIINLIVIIKLIKNKNDKNITNFAMAYLIFVIMISVILGIIIIFLK